MALTDANPAFGPAEQGIMLEMNEIDRFEAIWIDSDTFENFRFPTLANPVLRSSKIWFLELRELKIRDFVQKSLASGAFLKVPKKLRKRNFWIAELWSFKMR